MVTRNRIAVDRRRIKGGDLDPVYIAGGIVGIGAGDTTLIDAFGRIRTSDPVTLFDSQLQYDDQPILWETVTASGGTTTHQPDQSSLLMETTSTVGSSVIRQSRAYIRYQPGKSQTITVTGTLGPQVAGVRQRIGSFDAENGLFFQQQGTTVSVVRRSFVSGAAVDEVVNQAAWNIDKMDGTGVSGVTLDPTQAQVFLIDLQWLGVGRVRFGFLIDGIIRLCHQMNHANNISTVYMTTANLPLRYEIENVGASVAGSMRQICSQVSSEGGFQRELGLPHSVSNPANISVTTRRPIISLRPRLTFNGVTNRVRIDLEHFEALSADESIRLEMVYGGTLTGASWNDVNTTTSSLEFDVAATDISGGFTIEGAFVSATSTGVVASAGAAQQGITSRVPIALNIAGAHPTAPFTDSVSLVATSFVAAATGVRGSIEWREIR